MKPCWTEFAAKDAVAYRTAEQEVVLKPDKALIRARLSVVSPGTELALLHEQVLPRSHLQDRPPRYPALPGYAVAALDRRECFAAGFDWTAIGGTDDTSDGSSLKEKEGRDAAG